MINQEAAFETLKTQLRPRLKEFLNLENIKVSHNGMLCCLNPAHNDTNASMKILSDINDEQVWCYGCHATGDIFTVNHWINKKPLNGLEFIKENVFFLAKKFEIPYDDVQLSPEQVERIEQFRFNSIVVEKLTLKDERGEPINYTLKHCEKRGWNPRTCEKLGVCTILDYEKLLRDVQHATGLTLDEIKAKGVTSELFGPDCITIRLDDERGRCVGFTARNLKFKKDDKKNAPKYKNSAHSSVFQKGKILYGMSLVSKNKHRRLDIFEGNGSFITAYGAGHTTCVALSGSTLTDDQIELISTMGFTHINLVLDQDETGKAKTDEYMQKLSGIEGLRVECTKLLFKEEDNDLKDPEDFIKKYGLGEFFKLKPTGAFDWYLEKEAEGIKTGQINPVQFANKMIKVIFNTANRIERSRQRQKLSELTGIPERDLEAEIERIARISVSDVKNLATKKLSHAKSAEDISAVLEELKGSMGNTLETKSVTKVLSLEESLKSFDELIEVLDNKEPGLQGWTTGFPLLDIAISGIPKPIGLNAQKELVKMPGTLIGFPGAPQHGKSTIMQNIVLNMALRNEDIMVLYWALDDSRQRIIERMLAMSSGLSWRTITRRVPIAASERKLLSEHIDQMRSLMQDGKLIFKDHSNGSSLPTLMRWTEMMQEQFDKPTVIVIDSFHKIHGTESEGNLTDTARTRRFCEKLKSFAQTHNVTIMASIEMTKGQQRGIEPDLLNMSDSRKLEYDFDILGSVYNHFYDTDGQSDQIMVDMQGNIRPLIKLNLRKSKDGGSGPIFFALNKQNFRLQDYSMEDINRLTNLRQVRSTDIGGIVIRPPDTGGLTKTSIFDNEKEPWN